MPEPQLDKLLAMLSYELIEMLRLFREESSFKEVAVRFGRDERTVSRQLLDVDKAFRETQNVYLLDREPGKKNYHLTPAGEIFVDLLEPITEAIRAAIEAAAAATRRVPIICTSNCLKYFHQLNVALPANRSFDIIPLARRTAEIDYSFAMPSGSPETQVCLISALMSSEQEPAIGAVCSWNDRVEVLPLEIDSPKLLALDDLGFRRAVTAREAVEAGVTFLMPAGGVVWEFLNRSFPGWKQLRPFQHIPVPDLDYGLKFLSSRVVPRAAMIVHGLKPTLLESYGIGEARLHGFATLGSHRLLAVTGVFRTRQEVPPPEQDPYTVVWATAQSIWTERERV